MQQAPTPNESNSPGSVLTTTGTLQPTDKDIVFGRGKKYQDHEGNIRMRECINKYKKLYNALKRFQKQALVDNIYQKLVEDGARFLRKDEATDTWVLVERELATQKVSHALRCKKHLGKRDGSLKKIKESNNKNSCSSSCSSRSDTSSYLETTDSVQGDRKQMQMVLPTSSEAVGRVVTPLMESVLSSKTVTATPSLSNITFSPNMAHQIGGGTSIQNPIETLQVLQTLQMQDMMYQHQQQQMLAMMDLQRQAQQQAASAYYNAAMTQLFGIRQSAE